jgi:hypothetical protein
MPTESEHPMTAPGRGRKVEAVKAWAWQPQDGVLEYIRFDRAQVKWVYESELPFPVGKVVAVRIIRESDWRRIQAALKGKK